MKYCFITDESISDYAEAKSGQSFQYSIEVRGSEHVLSFVASDEWQSFFTHERKHILHCWLWNGEWPFEQGEILSPSLLARALRQIDYPKDFTQKLEHFFLSFYLAGGKEYMEFQYSEFDYLSTYSESLEEHERIILAAEKNEWIERLPDKSIDELVYKVIRILPPGRKAGNQLFEQKQLHLYSKENRPLVGKSITIVYAEEDKKWADKIYEQLGNRGATTLQNNGITSIDRTYLGGFKNNLKSVDFVLFIKSEHADNRRAWGDSLAAAVIHEELNRTRIFFMLYVDDTDAAEYQSLFFRQGGEYDIRIKPRQEVLFLDIAYQLTHRESNWVEAETAPSKSKNSPSDSVALLHDKIFEILSTWSDNCPDDYLNKFFYMRTREDERFKKGYWFPGDENFVAVSFWTGGDSLNRTPNIFLRVDTTNGIEVHLVGRDSENKKRYFAMLASKLNGYEVKGEKSNYWIKTLAPTNNSLSETILSFINSDKEFIDIFLQNTLDRIDEEAADLLEDDFSSKFGFLSSDQFYKLRSRVESRQKSKLVSNLERDIQALPITLRTISIKHFQGIQDAEIDEELPANSPWIFLTGENGYGKTSVLRAIALGLSNFDSNREYITDKVKLDMSYRKNGELFSLSTAFTFTDGTGTLNKQLLAYGPIRLIAQASSTESQEARNSSPIYNLFNRDGVMKNVSSVIKDSSFKKNKELDNIKTAIINVIDKRISDIEIDEEANVLYQEIDHEGNLIAKNSFENLATGYQGLINLIVDIISKFSKEFPEQTIQEYSGIVIIDELENHLHPFLQKRLPSLLSGILPNVQFIASIHSPIPLLGALEHSVILTVNRNAEDGITLTRVDQLFDMKTLNPNIILTSPIFGFKNIFPLQYDGSIDKMRTEDLYDDMIFRNILEEKLRKGLSS